MADPVFALVALFREALALSFGRDFADTDPMLRASKHADFQANCALGLAKTLKRPPREVATQLLEQLPQAGIIERAEVSGPGFINLWLNRMIHHRLYPNPLLIWVLHPLLHRKPS